MSLKDRCSFRRSLRYEVFLALNFLLNPGSRIHVGWKRKTLDTLPKQFFSSFALIGSAWELWSVMPAALPRHFDTAGIEALLDEIQKQPIRQFQETILKGMMHSDEAVSALLDRHLPFPRALSLVPKSKQEWLGYMGLYPFQKTAPMAIALEKLAEDPEELRGIVLSLTRIFWNSTFKDTWLRLEVQYQKSLEEKERLFRACSLDEFFRAALLRVDVDERKQCFKAARGGFVLPFENIESCHFLPSAFNDRRYWSALEEKGKKTVVYFPFFDPSIAVDPTTSQGKDDLSEPDLDPALIFKALGDSTRFAIASLVAKNPISSMELARQLGVSKPTISHHIGELRKAGLIHEQHRAGSIEISLRRRVVEEISRLAVRKLFEAEGKLELKTTRSR